MRRLSAYILLSFLAATTGPASAQTYKLLTSFVNNNGFRPTAPVVQSGKNFYGTTAGGGYSCEIDIGCGTVYEVTPMGRVTTLYEFCLQANCTDGANPESGLLETTDGNLYGTSANGGSSGDCVDTSGCGTVYRLNAEHKVVTIYDFCSQSNCTDGAYPQGDLIQGANGKLYGVATSGGANNFGVVFELTFSGKFTVIYSFCAETNCTDGAYPAAALTEDGNGHLFGTTQNGGAKGYGTVFDLAPGGKLTTLYSFCSKRGCTDGLQPLGGLVQDAAGNFYGTTSGGGANGFGTVFEVSPSGTLKTLHSFDNTDGAVPDAGLLQASDGNFYGTTSTGGAEGYGTIFKITAAGQLTTLYSFCEETYCNDGATPLAALIQATDGKLIGTTVTGGAWGNGTVFSLQVNLAP